MDIYSKNSTSSVFSEKAKSSSNYDKTAVKVGCNNFKTTRTIKYQEANFN